jgi:hypothetical protein
MALVWRLFQQPPRVGPWGLAASKSWFQAGESFASIPPNAAPEWQARSLGWRSKELMVACPLEGLVRRVSFHYTVSSFCITGQTMFKLIKFIEKLSSLIVPKLIP